MAHEVGSVSEEGRQLLGLLAEVDSLEQRPGWVAAAVRRHELEPVGEPLHRRPRARGVATAAVDQDDAHPDDPNRETKSGENEAVEPISGVTRFVMLAPMEPSPRSTFEPAGAGALLGGVTAASVGVGALVGWAAGSVGLGILGGAFVGIPAGVFAVYKRYRNAL
jgi:hypothetical protein